MMKNCEKLVSVIVPNYNHARFIHKRLDSIINQSHTNCEIIILDDCSTDGSQDILNHYEHIYKNVTHYVVNSKNSGSPFIQWERGLKLAKGDFIWIAESDDFAAEDFLEKCLQVFSTDQQIGLVYTQSYVVDENADVIRDNIDWTKDIDPNRWNVPFVNDGKKEAKNYLLKRNVIPNASAVVVKRSCFDSLFFWPKHMKMLGDWVIWTQLLANANVAYVPERLNYFRETSQSTRNHYSFVRKRRRLLEEIQVVTLNALIYKGNIKQYYYAYKRLLIGIGYLYYNALRAKKR
jgi:glycosyltransferase involved in cell wall biosynthesis